jgi:hypothetical protein
MSSPRKKHPREPEPPHEDVLADDPAIAVSCARAAARRRREAVAFWTY